MTHHRRARSRWGNNRLRIALFVNLDKTLCDLARFLQIARIERRLPTTRLSLIKLPLPPHLPPAPPQHRHATHTNARPQLIDQTRYEQRNLHKYDAAERTVGAALRGRPSLTSDLHF